METKKSTKDCIFEAAVELFSKQGYQGTSMRNLAKAVGIKKVLSITIIPVKDLFWTRFSIIRWPVSSTRTFKTIALDMLFNRTPKVYPTMNNVEISDLILFVGPVWMGHVAAPLRACFKVLKSNLKQYAFISISGGADGQNPKLADELKKRLGKNPAAVIDLHIAEILPSDPKPTREDTSSYILIKEDIKD